MQRFNAARSPRAAIAAYLREVKAEAVRRGYHFDSRRIAGVRGRGKLGSTDGQLIFEWQHLRAKLRKRSPEWLEQFRDLTVPSPHPLFEISAGDKEAWERGR